MILGGKPFDPSNPRFLSLLILKPTTSWHFKYFQRKCEQMKNSDQRDELVLVMVGVSFESMSDEICQRDGGGHELCDIYIYIYIYIMTVLLLNQHFPDFSNKRKQNL